MLLFIGLVLILICMVFISYLIKKNKLVVKHPKTFMTIIAILILIIIFAIITKSILPLIPHNDVSKEDRILLEQYILDKYNLQLTVTNSEIINRGDVGINSGIEYFFILKNKDGFEYSLKINKVYEADLKTILSQNPELDLAQMK